MALKKAIGEQVLTPFELYTCQLEVENLVNQRPIGRIPNYPIASCVTFLFLPHFDVICDLLLNRRTATWNLFVK